MLYGMSYAFLSTHARACYLAGSHGTQGWRLFFPYAMAVKTPSGIFLVLALAVAAAVYAPSPKPRPSSTRWSKSCPTRGDDESAADVPTLPASEALGGVGSHRPLGFARSSFARRRAHRPRRHHRRRRPVPFLDG